MESIIFLYGAIIGSFLNVCIYRIPRKKSIAFPSSHCPSCGTNLKWYELAPIFSFILKKGKCKYCGKKISHDYLIVELLNPIIYLIIYVNTGFTLELFFYATIFSLLIIIAFIDIDHMIIPDSLVIYILSLTIIYKLVSYILYSKSPEILNSVGGLVFSSLLFIIIIIVSKGGMGGGDVTLIGVLGFILGVKRIFLTIFLSFILGAIISIALLIVKVKGKKDPIPFGPFIILAFFMVLFWGDKLIYWYITNFLYK